MIKIDASKITPDERAGLEFLRTQRLLFKDLKVEDIAQRLMDESLAAASAAWAKYKEDNRAEMESLVGKLLLKPEVDRAKIRAIIDEAPKTGTAGDSASAAPAVTVPQAAKP